MASPDPTHLAARPASNHLRLPFKRFPRSVTFFRHEKHGKTFKGEILADSNKLKYNMLMLPERRFQTWTQWHWSSECRAAPIEIWRTKLSRSSLLKRQIDHLAKGDGQISQAWAEWTGDQNCTYRAFARRFKTPPC